jgi:type I restriction enzyme S subunit
MSLHRYDIYKDSGIEWIGEVPGHWRTGKVRQFARLESGHTPSRQHPEYWENCTVPWFTLADVWQIRDGHKTYVSETKERVSELGLINSSARLLPKGTAILSRTASVGFSAIMGCDMATTQDFANWVCGGQVIPEFLLYVLKGMGSEFDRLMMGSTHQTIYMPDIAKLAMAAPTLEEQTAIIGFLDYETAKIDALVEEQQRLIALLKEKRQAVISHAVTKGLDPNAPMKDSDVEWLGEVPAHWEVRSISSLSTKITNGYVGPTRDILVDEGVRYLQSLHIKNNRIIFDSPYFVRHEWSQEHSKSMLETGDVLIVQTGDIGQVAVVPEEFAGCNCHALIIVAPVRRVLSGNWLSWVLNSEYGRQSLESIQTGALHPHLNCGNVKELFIPVPPICEQQDIVAWIEGRLDGFGALISEAESAIALLQERRSALISAAVTGKIDVRGLAPVEEAA